MPIRHQPHPPHRGTLTLCVALSLLLHLALAYILPAPQPGHARRQGSAPATRRVQVSVHRPEAEAVTPERPVVKTSPDEHQRPPEQAEFEGRHTSRASGDNDAPERRTEAPLPTINGERDREEIVTFDQERQDGDLAHEGKLDSQTPPTPPARPRPEPEKPQPTPAPLTQGQPDGHPDAPPAKAPSPEEPHPSEGTASTHPTPPSAEGELKLREPDARPHPADEAPHAVTQGSPEGQAPTPTPPNSPAHSPRMAVYDPSLAPHAQQPGFRTHERRTRSSGRFVFGSRPALNVAATARGAYEADIYRRIARAWYAACDEHRGDIIPGSITVSLRLSRSGRIDSMKLMNRRGASLIQQSFSFGSIRRASLPPMPQAVQQEVVGELFEMILTFNFD